MNNKQTNILKETAEKELEKYGMPILTTDEYNEIADRGDEKRKCNVKYEV